MFVRKISYLRDMKEENKDNKIIEPTRSELEILQVLWQFGPSTVRFVNDKLNEQKREVNYTSTLKLMQIMAEKGLVSRDESARTHIYTARASQGSTQRQLVASNAKGDDDMIEVEVSDTGHGFPDDVKANLFQTFFTTKATGMGVGLSISRSIIEAHGGRMWAENNSSGGATFRFTLPAAPSES